MIHWSDGLLGTKERLLLRRLAIFAGGWTLEAAEDVCSGSGIKAWEVLDLLARLMEICLVEMDTRARSITDQVRYRMLEPIRAFAVEELARETEMEQSIRTRHLGHFLSLAEQASPCLKGADQQRWLGILDADRDNFRRALDSALDPGVATDLGLRLVVALERYWTMRAFWDEGWRTTDSMLQGPGAAAPTPERGMAMVNAGVWRVLAGELEEADGLFDNALSIARAIGERRILARALNNKAVVANQMGDLRQAMLLLEEYIEIEREQGSQSGVASALTNLGLVAERGGGPPPGHGSVPGESRCLP